MALSSARFNAILMKEFIQMRRDRMTFAMMIALPIVQLILFGFAINTDPRHLPTVLVAHQSSQFSRTFISAMKVSTYFDIVEIVRDPAVADARLKSGDAVFIVEIPGDFERQIIRGEKPALLVTADASDPAASGIASGAVPAIARSSLAAIATGPLAFLQTAPAPFATIIHKRYNPAGVTSYNIVPGLLAVILSMTMVMITAIAIVRETERGTMETLLSTPARPLEVMGGKILPYVIVGYVQTAVFFLLARLVFKVPFEGDILPFIAGLNLFIIVNLALGFLVSTVARNQMQAMQMSFFYILPSILLSGFMFPFAAMPPWAQTIGSIVPSTHFMRIVRKIMLKGSDLADITHDMRALGITLAVITALAMLRYRQTLE